MPTILGTAGEEEGYRIARIPHRLNAEERNIYDRARQKGFVEITGSGWRKQRRMRRS